MHEVYECRLRIRQSKGHHCKLKGPITRPKRYLRDIYLPDPQLMVTSAKVYLGLDSRSSQLIKQIVNPRQWLPILDRKPVQLPVIHAHTRVLSFFFANRTGVPHGEVLGLMNPLSSSLCSWTLSSCNSTGAILFGVIEMGEVPGCNLIPKSTTHYGGNPGSSFGKTSSYSQTSRGRSKSGLTWSSRVRLASQPANCPRHLDSYTVWGKISCLSL